MDSVHYFKNTRVSVKKVVRLILYSETTAWYKQKDIKRLKFQVYLYSVTCLHGEHRENLTTVFYGAHPFMEFLSGKNGLAYRIKSHL
jgi:hypothetical protein